MLAEAARHSEAFDRSKLQALPLSGTAILTCMDARLELEEMLGLRAGDMHVIRNAGGLASGDAIRSLVVSHHLLGTREVVVINHTGCGLLNLDDVTTRARLARETGRLADIDFGGFTDVRANLLAQVQKIREHQWLQGVPVHGLLYHVETGKLDELA